MATDNLGLYVHIPFCASKCKYCDFSSFEGITAQTRESYLARLTEEAESYKSEPKIKIDTVFFGGGTPSLLTESEFKKVVSAIRKSFDISPDAEFTVEANPGTVTYEKLKAFAGEGVNRISFGAQSFCENELKRLGRIHSVGDIKASFEMARRAGITNISLDLMYGIPEQTPDSFRHSLVSALALSPTHISAYGLIIEEGTPFYSERELLPLPTEDEECDMYLEAVRILTEAGFSHYEISNYARPSYECRHNLKYWRDQQYIGIGLSAYSYFGTSRYGNSSRIPEYISDNYTEYRQTDSLSLADEKFEYAMMRLRLAEGMSLDEYNGLFGEDFFEKNSEKILHYKALGYINIVNGRISLSDKGLYISNSILAELL
ncbi:MAG: radical SAM family heme chaperone HemW [Clostridia bacterium]|nr:radical SAM family heme chaperone HemW [Clostridia bacterium]